ncbi:cell division protein FtsZ [Alkanindiges sp. WGS2144]|uniref:cell division protein FtsZ n=1 Tax=Alkanindiges sp. WGS2144 TaxID=3366808 RepID=UPI00375008A1
MSSFTLIEDEVIDNNGQARFTVFGVGGGGGNAVQHMVESEINGVKFICANTDKQALDRMKAPFNVQLGQQSTRGLGAGANPEVGRTSAEEARDQIREQLEGTDMVFVTAGMGGGTGTGAAPVVAEVAKEMGILTVGVVTTPFGFEGRKRQKSAEKGIDELEKHVDSLIIIPNEKLLTVYGDLSMKEAFKKADDVLLNAVRSIFDLVVNHGHINLDFADLKTAMSTRGYAMMGIGMGRGEDRARQAAEQAIRSPLLDQVRLENAKGVLINITSADDVKPREIQAISDVVSQIADLDEGDIFYGTVFDPDARDELRVTVIATGLTRDPIDFSGQVTRQQPVAATQQNQATAAPVQDEDDAPAISRRAPTASPAVPAAAPQPAPAARPAPMSIQDYLKNQQKK